MEFIENGRQNGKSVEDRLRSKTVVSRLCLVKFFKSNVLVILMLLGVLLGVAIGVGLSKMDPKLNQIQITYLQFPGDLFIQLMKMLIIPILVSSLVTSTANMDIRSSGKIGLRAVVYYMSTLILASALGITLAVTVRPGERIGSRTDTSSQTYQVSSSPANAFMDLLRNMVPDNLIEVYFMSKKTETVVTETRSFGNHGNSHINISNISLIETFNNLSDIADLGKDVGGDNVSLVTKKVSGTNMIGLVIVSILFGCVISVVGEEARPLLHLFSALQVVSFRLLSIFIWATPVGVAFLIAAKLAQVDDPSEMLQHLVVFSVTVLAGLFFHALVVLPLIFFIFVRKNPFKFILGLLPALVFAFGSESSAATLPLTIKCLQEKNRVDARVVNLVASLGATVNMDGMCFYYTLMPIFVAQINNISLSPGDYLTLCLLAISMTAGAAGIPGLNVVFMLMMLTAMQLPTNDVSLLLAVEWFLTRFKTTVNVLGDGIGAGIIEHLSRRELRKMDQRLPCIREKEMPKPTPEDESVALMVEQIVE